MRHPIILGYSDVVQLSGEVMDMSQASKPIAKLRHRRGVGDIYARTGFTVIAEDLRHICVINVAFRPCTDDSMNRITAWTFPSEGCLLNVVIEANVWRSNPQSAEVPTVSEYVYGVATVDGIRDYEIQIDCISIH